MPESPLRVLDPGMRTSPPSWLSVPKNISPAAVKVNSFQERDAQGRWPPALVQQGFAAFGALWAGQPPGGEFSERTGESFSNQPRMPIKCNIELDISVRRDYTDSFVFQNSARKLSPGRKFCEYGHWRRKHLPSWFRKDRGSCAFGSGGRFSGNSGQLDYPSHSRGRLAGPDFGPLTIRARSPAPRRFP